MSAPLAHHDDLAAGVTTAIPAPNDTTVTGLAPSPATAAPESEPQSDPKRVLVEQPRDTTSSATATAGRKEPPPEKPSDIRRRTLVIFSFWLIVLLLGLPIWWHTTAIPRANLPLDAMMDWADGKVGGHVTNASLLESQIPC